MKTEKKSHQPGKKANVVPGLGGWVRGCTGTPWSADPANALVCTASEGTHAEGRTAWLIGAEGFAKPTYEIIAPIPGRPPSGQVAELRPES